MLSDNLDAKTPETDRTVATEQALARLHAARDAALDCLRAARRSYVAAATAASLAGCDTDAIVAIITEDLPEEIR